MRLALSLDNPADYQRFLAIRRLPRYRFTGREAWFPDEYAAQLGIKAKPAKQRPFTPASFLFDYQRAIAEIATRKRKYAVFADCGLGKTLILLEFAQYAAWATKKPVLIVSPLMVIPQTIAEHARWYPLDKPIQQVRASGLGDWLAKGKGIGITNYDAMELGLDGARLGGLILDESSMLKSHYGKWGQACINLGRGVPYKLCCTGTPAPNDRIEYANHSVFLDQARTVNEFLARYFVNRGQTDNRWELKPHALRPFYRDLSHWSIFLSDPSVYGWKDNAEPLPPIHVHIDDVSLTPEQRQAVNERTGQLVVATMGGITTRSKLARLAKGFDGDNSIPTNKPAHIKALVESWPDESTIIWCWYNQEQEQLEKVFPDAASIDGSTPLEKRIELIDDFKSGRRRIMLSKPKVLGFGLNLQVATRQIFSSLIDSYEAYYQCIKRSNRFGATKPLNVHIPITEIELPMVETVLRKAKRVESDTREQEALFREVGVVA